MKILIKWFVENQSILVSKMQQSHHNFTQSSTNPFHLEGDVWSHTMMVCKIAELQKYAIDVQVSALLHDIGKPSCRVTDDINGFVMFSGHEKVSSEMSDEILKKMANDGVIPKSPIFRNRVKNIIANHADLYRLNKEQLIDKYYGNSMLFDVVCQLSYADTEGSFASMGGVDWKMVNEVKKLI